MGIFGSQKIFAISFATQYRNFRNNTKLECFKPTFSTKEKIKYFTVSIKQKIFPTDRLDLSFGFCDTM